MTGEIAPISSFGRLLSGNYVAGTDPTNLASKLAATIKMGADGKPILSWKPPLNGEDADGAGIREGVRLYSECWALVSVKNVQRARFLHIVCRIGQAVCNGAFRTDQQADSNRRDGFEQSDAAFQRRYLRHSAGRESDDRRSRAWRHGTGGTDCEAWNRTGDEISGGPSDVMRLRALPGARSGRPSLSVSPPVLRRLAECCLEGVRQVGRGAVSRETGDVRYRAVRRFQQELHAGETLTADFRAD